MKSYLLLGLGITLQILLAGQAWAQQCFDLHHMRCSQLVNVPNVPCYTYECDSTPTGAECRPNPGGHTITNNYGDTLTPSLAGIGDPVDAGLVVCSIGWSCYDCGFEVIDGVLMFVCQPRDPVDDVTWPILQGNPCP